MTYVNASNSQLSHISSLYARSSWLLSAWDVGYAIEFLFLSVVKLLVLDRTLDLACKCMSFHHCEFVTLCDLTPCLAASTPESGPIAQRFQWYGRAVLAFVTFGNVVGLCGNIAASVYTARAATYSENAAAAFAAGDSAEGSRLSQQVNPSFQLADVAESVQQFCEVVVLIIIIVAFTVVGVAFARVANRALRNLKLAAAGDLEAAGASCRSQIQ